MPYYPNIADSFTRGLQAGTELGGSIVDGINRRKMMERQDEQDARADAILQIQNPGLKIGRKIKGVDGRPDALSAEAVLPGQENDIVKPLGGGATYNVSERDRVDSAIAEREEKQALRRMEAQILLEKKYKDKKRTYDSTSGKQIFENADGSLSYDDVYRAGAGDPLKGQFDRESDRRATESDADFKRRVLLEEADRTFKSGEADKDRTFQKSLSDIKAGLKITGKAPTESMQKAGGFANRMKEAESVFDKLEQEGFDPSTVNPLKDAGQAIANTATGIGEKLQNIPLVGGLIPDRPNAWSRKTTQKFEQAKRNFINSVLRRESGAVISPQEFENANQQYFPVVGDSDELKIQKKQNRKTVEKSFRKEGLGENVAEGESDQPQDEKDPLGLFK